MPAQDTLLRDQIVVMICMVLSGVVLLSLGELPSRYVEVEALGSPLGIPLGGPGLVALLLVAMIAAGMHGIVRSLAERPRVELWYSATFAILPGLVTLAAVASVPRQFGNTATWLVSLATLGTLLAVVVVAECGTVRVDHPHYRGARLGLNIATYSAALALYASIYSLQVRSLLSATAVILVTFPLALDLLRGTEEQLKTTWLYAAIIALVTGEITWTLNALGLRALYGGGLILVVFYTLTGLTQQHLAERLSRSVAVEFTTIAALALGLLMLGLRLQPEIPLTGAPSADAVFAPTGTDAFTFAQPPLPSVPVILYPPSPSLPVDPWFGAPTGAQYSASSVHTWPIVLQPPSPLRPQEPEVAP